MHFKYILAGGAIYAAFMMFFDSPNEHSVRAAGMNYYSSGGREYTVTGVGDMMYGTAFPSPRYLPPHDNPGSLISDLRDTLKSSDITFGNLEGSFLNNGEPFKTCRDTSLCYLFRMPERYSYVLKEAGFDFLSLANNHFGDFGWRAASRTMKLLDSLGIKYAGPPESEYAVIQGDSVKWGFCAFSTTAGSINMNDTAKTDDIVRKLARECDIVIVSFHGGAEGADYQHVTKKTEMFYGEDRGNVYEFAHRMIDCGADIVFGHGPHVARAVEIYRDRFIDYSLGNFCTYGRFNITGPGGYAPVMRVKVDKAGRFISGRIIPIYQGEDGIVRIDPEKRAIRKIRELVALDFPDAGYSVSDNGEIYYK
ncbi:MAG: CapA family protein [Bacteroidales bacterium]|jgi:poly-gamma-glutamate capsule biosynthesis protein CapA/YwtB (metallophosphatase superfamily)